MSHMFSKVLSHKVIIWEKLKLVKDMIIWDCTLL